MHRTEPCDQLLSTFSTLRIGMGLIALAFPLVLWIGGNFFGIELQRSMSVYYHTPMRNAFVGILFSIGSFLYLYKGFSKQENRIYNLAGLMALGVVFFPIDIPTELAPIAYPDVYTNRPLHLIFATAFFLLIAYACLKESSAGSPGDRQVHGQTYRRIYQILAAAHVLLPMAALVCSLLLRNREAAQYSTLVFFIEAAAVWAFAGFWITRSVEPGVAAREAKALEPVVDTVRQ